MKTTYILAKTSRGYADLRLKEEGGRDWTVIAVNHNSTWEDTWEPHGFDAGKDTFAPLVQEAIEKNLASLEVVREAPGGNRTLSVRIISEEEAAMILFQVER